MKDFLEKDSIGCKSDMERVADARMPFAGAIDKCAKTGQTEAGRPCSRPRLLLLGVLRFPAFQ
jgi:hypothetical protein